jgi:hypothetical protein
LGPQGPSGPSGPTGPIGYAGSASTVSGPLGYTGSIGTGYTGSRSTLPGPTGPPGYTGSQGFTGYTGSVGPQGYAGSRGYAGSVGPIAGSDTSIIYNNSGVSAGSLNLTWNGTNLYVNGGINATGDVTAFYTSDSRLKTNIENISNALEKTMTLNGVTFNWNTLAEDKDLSSREPGVIAQEIQAVLPEAVSLRDNGFLSVRYDKIIPLLIEAIKELGAELKDLKKKID